MTRKAHPSRGFTLIEVLVASFMVAVIAASLAASLHVAFKARRSAMAGTQTTRDARLAMDELGRDFRAATGPNGVLAGIFGTVGDDDSLGRGNNSVTFYDIVGPNQVVDGGGDVEQVTLAIVTEADLNLNPTNTPAVGAPGAATPGAPQAKTIGGSSTSSFAGGDDGILVRRVVRQLLAPQAPTPVDQVLCRHVRSVSFMFWDGTAWNPDWDSTQRNNVLPLAVQVTLEIAASEPDSTGQKPSYTLVRIFPIPCGMPSADNTGS